MYMFHLSLTLPGPFLIHDWVCSQINTTGVTSGAGTIYLSGAPEFTPGFSGVRVTRSIVLCVCFVDRCLSFCTFSFGHNIVGIFKLIFCLISSLQYAMQELCQRSSSHHCGLLFRSFVIQWFLSLWFVIQKIYQRSGSRHCSMLCRSFIKGVVLVIVVCYIEALSKEWFLSLWFVIQKLYQRSCSPHCGMFY